MSLPFYDACAKNTPLEPQKLPVSDQNLIRAAFILAGILVVWKLYVGLISHVIWEEGHFVVSGEYLALGYPDIPAGFPWLARLITTVFGWHVMPLRLVALTIATAMPWAVWFMAKPVASPRNAIWAAIIAMLLPPISLNGTVFYPEGALQLLLALMLGCLLRAIQTDRLRWWVWTGVCAALGLLVHFRFLVPGLAVIAFMLATPQGRGLWRLRGIWITAGIAFLGLLPSVIYNGLEGWPAIQFHVINRPRFDPAPKHIMGFIETQIGICTPVFFIAMIAGGKLCLKRDRLLPAALLAYQSLIIFLFYCMQATINKKVMPHWPFLAYIPLLPYVPEVLGGFINTGKSLPTRYLRMVLVATGPVLAVALGIAASLYQYEYRHSAELSYKDRENNVLKNENWLLLEPDLAAAKARAIARFGPDIAIAATGHISAVHLEFPGDFKNDRHVYTLDEPYDVQVSRFVVARHDWGLDRAALLKDYAGKGVVLALLEPSYVYHDPEAVKYYGDLCKNFEDIEPFKISSLPPYRTSIDFYTARVRTTPLTDISKSPCALLPQLYIAHPERGQYLSKHNSGQYFGIAADPIGIKAVDILIDGKVVTRADYGVDDIGYHVPALLKYDPNWPKIQYTFTFPPGSLVPGEHVLSIEAVRSDGTRVKGDPRTLYVH